MAQQRPPAAPSAEPIRIAVVGFASHNAPEGAPLGLWVAEELTARLAVDGEHYTLLERNQLHSLLAPRPKFPD